MTRHTSNGLVIALLSLALAACGDDDGGSATDAAVDAIDADQNAPDAGPRPDAGPGMIVFEEDFNTDPGSDLSYSFAGSKFGDTGTPWAQEHRATDGIGGSGCLRVEANGNDQDDCSVTAFADTNFGGQYPNFHWRGCWKMSAGWPNHSSNPLGDQKLTYQLDATTAVGLTVSSVTGTFVLGEEVLFQTSGELMDVIVLEGNLLRLMNYEALPQVGETVVGMTSGATATVDEISELERANAENLFLHNRGNGLEFSFQRQYNTGVTVYPDVNSDLPSHQNLFILDDHANEWWCVEIGHDYDQNPWVTKLWVTTSWGAANLAVGTTGLDGDIRHFNDYLYLQNTWANPPYDADKSYDAFQFGAFINENVSAGEFMYLDEWVVSTGKIGHPF